MADNEHKEQPQQPGTHHATVKESTELLKRLAEFSSRKEEMLKKLASISDRMEQRIGAGAGAPSVPMPDLIPTDGASHTQPTPTAFRAPEPFHKVVYTRVRETQKPIFLQGCVSIAFPSKRAVTEEWLKLASQGTEPSFEVRDEGIFLAKDGVITIPTGIKLALPNDIGIHFASNKTLSVLSPTLFISQFKEEELAITVKNITDNETALLFDVPLFMGYPIHLATNIGCEELLNSTYDDWVHGTING